tara:strand:- start:1306 stop:1551 length:246 start_codon:yes stop_codon:yes gene_type:complete
MVINNNSVEQLVEKLLSDVPEKNRCPDIRKDEIGTYCGHNLKEKEEVCDIRRMICGTASLQFWCLNKKGYKTCIYHKGYPL